MPRAKRAETFVTLECAACCKSFTAKRDDAKTCSSRCRQVWSRALRKMLKGYDSSKSLRNDGKKVCAHCGIKRDGRAKKCPTCGQV